MTPAKTVSSVGWDSGGRIAIRPYGMERGMLVAGDLPVAPYGGARTRAMKLFSSSGLKGLER